MADVAALVVALSAQVSKFEKDMKQAVDVADKRTKEIENSFSKMNTAVANELSSLAAIATRSFGALGAVIVGLNPALLAIAAGVGAAILAFQSLSESIDRFVEKSKALQDTADLTGFTVSQLKSLGKAGRTVGVDFETIERAIVKFSIAFEELRNKGTGPLEEALRRFPGLAKQVAQATDVQEALTLVSKAVAELDDKQKQLGVSTSFTGKRSAEFLRLLVLISDKKLLDPQNIDEGTKEFDALTKQIVNLQREIEAVKKEGADIVGKAITVKALQLELEYARGLTATKKALLEVKKQADDTGAALEDMQALPGGVSEGVPSLQPVQRPAAKEAAAFLPELTDNTKKATDAATKLDEKSKDWTDTLKAGLQADIQSFNLLSGVVSTALTQQELLIQKQRQLQVAVLEGRIKPEDQARELAAFSLAQQQQTDALKQRLGLLTLEQRLQSQINQLRGEGARLSLTQGEIDKGEQRLADLERQRIAGIKERMGLLKIEEETRAKVDQFLTEAADTELSLTEIARGRANIERQGAERLQQERERLGITSEEEIIKTRLNKLDADAYRLGLTKLDVEKATNIQRREAKELAEQTQIRASALPQLKRLELDARDLGKQIDQIAVTTFGNFENALADVAAGTTKLSEAFKRMTESIIRDLVRMALRIAITAPLAGALQQAFGPLANVSVPARQRGGPVSPGSPYIVGEHGAELFVPKTAGTIVPGNISKPGTSAGLKVVVNNYASGVTDTTQERRQGATGEELIIGIVKRVTSSGELDNSNRARFGLRPQKVR